MTKQERGLLNPTARSLRSGIKAHEKKHEYAEKLLYHQCVNDMKRVEFSSISLDEVMGPLRTFLINWGIMGRVLNHKDRRGWETRLVKVIRKNARILEDFRFKRLERSNLEPIEKDVRHVYTEFRKLIAPTSAGKALHLLCPKFFPLWDSAIRKYVGESRGRGIGSGDKGYFEFMKEVQRFSRAYDRQLSDLSKECRRKSKLRLIDEYLYDKAKRIKDEEKKRKKRAE